MKKRTEVERVIHDMEKSCDAILSPRLAVRLARWHLAEVRCARGRTVAFCAYHPDDTSTELWANATDAKDACLADGNADEMRVARVVLVPRRRK